MKISTCAMKTLAFLYSVTKFLKIEIYFLLNEYRIKEQLN